MTSFYSSTPSEFNGKFFVSRHYGGEGSYETQVSPLRDNSTTLSQRARLPQQEKDKARSLDTLGERIYYTPSPIYHMHVRDIQPSETKRTAFRKSKPTDTSVPFLCLPMPKEKLQLHRLVSILQWLFPSHRGVIPIRS
ncbi:hypothetical protein FRC18_007928 [Serendipita sp. 400]|nr:hypothetical protein FRC18_007928 [Serendipita sp. 400]